MASVLITGSTGMVGKGVLLECLADSSIDQVILLNRSPIDIADNKIKEIITKDFTSLEGIKTQIENLDACFHCMGVSAVGLSEEQYHKLTYDVTRALADLCYAINPEMTFNYVSGEGTDSSEKGRVMWARVKGKAENYILNKGFAKAYAFRPGIIIPEKGIRSRTKLYDRAYTVLKPVFPVLKKLNGVTTTTKIGQAMIKTLAMPHQEVQHPTNKVINKWAAGS